MKPAPDHPRRRRGFTLLEMVLALALLSLVIGMVFAVTSSTLKLGDSVIEEQNSEMLSQAFFDLLGKRFSSLPGNARLELTYKDTGGQYLSDLTLQNVPMSFTWGGQPRVAKAVQLSTVRRRSGFLSIVLRYYETEILEGSDAAANKTPAAAPPEPFAEIELLSDVAYFEWRVLDGRSMEWQYDWDIQGRLPLQLELVTKFGARGDEMRHIFWIAPKLNPETVLRQNVQNQANQNPGTATPGAGGGPSINLPASPQPGGGNPNPNRRPSRSR